MAGQIGETCTHFPHNRRDEVHESSIAYSAEGSRQIEILFRELEAVGVMLLIVDGRLAFDAPAGVMKGELLTRVRKSRDSLLAALQGEQAATPEPLGASCPYCRSELLEDVEPGWRCYECKQLAWVWTVGGSIVRADCERMNLQWPASHSDSTNSRD